MKKRLLCLAVCILSCLCFSACREETDSSVSSETETETVTASEEITEETTEALTFAERVESFREPDAVHIFDECSVLSDEEKQNCSKYAAWLDDTYGIHAAIVITDHLDGASADSFASAYYDTLYDDEDGFLILINNDTNEDRVYTVGECRTYITQEAIALAIAQSTPELVEGAYAPALERLLQLGEGMAQKPAEESSTSTAQSESTASVSE